jgi:hypothetical protein
MPASYPYTGRFECRSGRNVAQISSQVPFRTNLAGKSGGVLDCRDHLAESYPMSDEQDLNTQRTRMMEIWHEYGKTYNVFVPTGQPVPRAWDRPLQEPEDKSKWNPQTIKHWRFFELTKRLLKRRYGILSGPALTFDCQVPRFQTRLSQYKPRPRERLHQNGDPLQWYMDALEI